MARFLHTADWQLGMRATGLGEAAARARRSRFETVGSTMELAVDRAVDFILVAGDMFEDNGVANDAIYRATAALRKASPIPVFILPGNHDPYTADSVFLRPAWRGDVPENVTVLHERKPLERGGCGVVLLPCPLTQKQSSADPTAWLHEADVEPGEAIRVGLAHGSLDIHGQEYNFPVAPDCAERAGLDYLALGDWHRTYIHGPRTAYSGTPEQTDFGESGTGNALLVEIPTRGELPRIEEAPVGGLEWLRWEEQYAPGLVEELRQRIRAIGDPERTLLQLSLRGAVAPQVLGEVRSLAQLGSSRLLHFRLDDADLHLMPDLDDLRAELPPGALRDTCDVLMALHLAAEGAVERPVEEVKELLEDLPDAVCTDRNAVERALQILCELSQTSQ